VDKGLQMVRVSEKLMGALTWDRARLKDACTEAILATHRAVDLAKAGTPFRDAYRAAAKELKEGDTGAWQYTDQEILDGLRHLGAPGNPGLKEAEARIAAMSKWIEETQAELEAKWKALVKSEAR
jgi:argininosuccinate lyase